jgi:predicted O-methyltransferase YrrM
MQTIKSLLRRLLRSSGYSIHDTRWIEYLEQHQCPWVPPGHFFSPYPNLDEIRRNEAQIFNQDKPILGIDLREEQQFEMLKTIGSLYPSMKFPEAKNPRCRYYFDNETYTYSDGIVLHAMLRIIQPKRLIEIGCGYSSAMILDTNELNFQSQLRITFVEPYPKVLRSLMKPQDEASVTIIESKLENLDPTLFEELAENDILFIDSTHVSKVNSDVNFIFFEILPRLRRGVHIHFHDIFYPFEYLKEWIYQGWAWQEAYLLHAFLQDNQRYQITYFQDFMFKKYHHYFEEYLPLCLKNGGGSLWLKKVC